MRKIITLFTALLLLLSSSGLIAQKFRFEGARNMISSKGRNFPLKNHLDASGNIYVCGNFRDTAMFDGASNPIYSNGGGDAYIVKYDKNGFFQWVRQFGNENTEVAYDIASDGSGNVYMTGFFVDTLDFDPGPNTFNLIAGSTISSADKFLVKLNASGDFVWAKQIAGFDDSPSVCTDSVGNIYLSGEFEGTVDFDPNSGVQNLTSNGGTDGFLVKLDSLGNFIWAQQYGGTNDDKVYSIASDKKGGVYITGSFRLTVDFDPGPAVYNLSANSIGESTFIVKIDTAGNFTWAKHFRSNSIIPNDIVVDDSLNVLTTGEFSSTVNFNPGLTPYLVNKNGPGSDVFVSKLDSLGGLVWAKSLTSRENDIGYSVAVDKNCNVYTTGSFRIDADFDPGLDTFAITASGKNDAFISKLTPSGNFVWAHSYGNSNEDVGYSILVNDSGTIYLSGIFTDSIDFNPSPFQDFYLDSQGETDNDFDAFLLLMSSCPLITSSVSISSCYSYTHTSPSGTYVWDSTGVYIDTIQLIDGCDSIVTINLTILDSSSSILDTNICYSYTSPSGLYTWDSTGVYIDTLVNNLGCDSIITVNLTINGVDTAVTDTNNILTASQSLASYKWYNCDTGTPTGDTLQAFIPIVNGNYAVEITTSSGCIDTSACYSIQDIGLQESVLQTNLSYYPNPTSGNVTIDLGEKYKTINVRVMNVYGQLIASSQYHNTQELNLDITGTKGYYIIELETEDGQKASLRVLKE